MASGLDEVPDEDIAKAFSVRAGLKCHVENAVTSSVGYRVYCSSLADHDCARVLGLRSRGDWLHLRCAILPHHYRTFTY
jgi:hypothetical protein